ncbi:TlpA disulfide reductase family protein [Halomonas nitroreducens]|uniref:TlpA family protein disulfide reductase n=1 Tax=Halomonas nitroreducens TaxID=447425 RepID=A0A431V929_9GAMM|nr:TlpA disulfide reductase family protein [Halomonas nitroreducens]RTR07179.1 TlpA family protein disulfide reductase [Halomonas nitroreducens]
MSLLDRSLAIGPFGLSLERWLLIAAALIALLVGGLLGRRRRVAVGDALLTALVVGLIAARLAFVLRYSGQFEGFVAMLDIRDGGFRPLAGLLGAGAFLAWRAWRWPVTRRPLAGAVLAGGLVWTGLAGSLQLIGTTSRPLPEVAMTTLAGEPISLPTFAKPRGRPMVVNLWASWCPPCRREMPVLAAAQRRHGDIDFVFANQGENRARVEDFLATEGLGGLRHVWLDRPGQLGRTTGAQVMPTTLFYSAGGRLVDSHVGELSRASLTPYLERLTTAPTSTDTRG